MDLVKVVSYNTEDSKTYCVVFDNGAEEIFSDEEFFEHGLYDTDLPLNTDYLLLMKKVNLKRCYRRAVSFLRGSLKPKKDVIVCLKEEGFSSDIIDEAITRLCDEGCLDDRRYCSKIIKKRLDSGNCSSLYIKSELRERGIDEEIIITCLEEAGADDKIIAEKLMQKKLKAGDSPEKIKRYLSGKGFSLGTILSIFEDCGV